MAILLSNQILEAAEQQIERGLTPENRADYEKIVTAGQMVALKGGPNSILASLKNSKNVIHDCVAAALHLVALMSTHSHGTMPPQAMIPAAFTLMLKGLDTAVKMGIAKIGTPELIQATHVFANMAFQEKKITAGMLSHAAGKVHAITQDPAAMQKLHAAAGTRAPAPGAA